MVRDATSAQVSADDLWWFFLTSVRYSLGRKSYAPSLTADLFARYGYVLTSQQKQQAAEEIRSYLSSCESDGSAYADITATWNTLAHQLSCEDDQ